MLEQHGKAFAFTSKEIGCVDPKIVEPMVIFTIDHVPWNLKADSSATGAYSENHRPAQGEGGDGDSRAIERSVLKSMVYGSEEEWVTPIYPRLVTGEMLEQHGKAFAFTSKEI